MKYRGSIKGFLLGIKILEDVVRNRGVVLQKLQTDLGGSLKIRRTAGVFKTSATSNIPHSARIGGNKSEWAWSDLESSPGAEHF